MSLIRLYKGLSLLLLLFATAHAAAQADTSGLVSSYTVPVKRQLAHEGVDKEQQLLQNTIDSTRQPALATAVSAKIDNLQYKIETSALLDHRLQLSYLKGLGGVLKNARQNKGAGKIQPVQFPAILSSFEAAMDKEIRGENMAAIIEAMPYETGMAVLDAGVFEKNPGYQQARASLLLKYCTLYPNETFAVLRDNPGLPFTDSLVKVAGKKYPGQLYDYAQAGNELARRIRAINDDAFVKAVVYMSKSKSGQQYFPFLDNIVSGVISFDSIDAAEADSVRYFRLLVKTQLAYVKRAMNKDTAFAFKELTAKLEKKARDIFVTTINGLHNERDEVRFRSIQSLAAEELYYLAVLTNGLIYTSSYTNGVYPLLMKKINNRGDSLLALVQFDRYRKFISQAAAYNKLGNFLSSFPDDSARHKLMEGFVYKLEEAEGLEDGVDVADSYASIFETLKPVAGEMLENVNRNYERNQLSANEKGMAIYKILQQLFLSADSSNKVDLTTALGIPPVYNVNAGSLTNEKGEVVMQMFFYGDEDGKLDFTIFLNMFANANWTVDKTNEQWVVVRSAKGKPVSIYANIPFDEETGEDDKAQQALRGYFTTHKIVPMVTINRGHSYHAETTIAYMSPASRIVFMGSCGGFNLIDAILKKSPDAHIIASKQIGKRDINKPFFSLLTEKLRAGKDIEWIPFWKEFNNNAKVAGFEDYIPPFKNLGAIFIKAYRIALQKTAAGG